MIEGKRHYNDEAAEEEQEEMSEKETKTESSHLPMNKKYEGREHSDN